MSSHRQWNANQNNAKKSTGPRTLKGKEKSSRNALKHSLAGRTAMILDVDRPHFEVLLNEVRIHARPLDDLGLRLAEHTALAILRKERAAEMQVGLLNTLRIKMIAEGALPKTDEDGSPSDGGGGKEDELRPEPAALAMARAGWIEQAKRDLNGCPETVVDRLAYLPEGADWLIERWGRLRLAFAERGRLSIDETLAAAVLLGFADQVRFSGFREVGACYDTAQPILLQLHGACLRLTPEKEVAAPYWSQLAGYDAGYDSDAGLRLRAEMMGRAQPTAELAAAELAEILAARAEHFQALRDAAEARKGTPTEFPIGMLQAYNVPFERARKVEEELDPESLLDQDQEMQRLRQYEAVAERAMFRGLAELRRMRRELMRPDPPEAFGSGEVGTGWDDPRRDGYVGVSAGGGPPRPVASGDGGPISAPKAVPASETGRGRGTNPIPGVPEGSKGTDSGSQTTPERSRGRRKRRRKGPNR